MHLWPPLAGDTIDAGTVLEGAPRKESSGRDGRSACGVGVDVLEDGGDHTRLGDHCQHAHCCAAARIGDRLAGPCDTVVDALEQ